LSAVLPQPSWRDSARRILPLAWPVFIAQLAVVAFGTVDTLLVARYAALDLAALAVGSAAYITVFIGFMGVVVAAGPIVGQFFGARQLHEAGFQLHQAVWMALALSLLGSALLAFPWPFLAIAQATPEVEAKVRQYLMALAFALPAALLFAAYRSFNNAVSRPKAVMVIQLAGLGLKVPLSAALVFGVPGFGIPALGVLGCGIATVIAMWSQVAAGLWVLLHDRFYAPFALGRRLRPPAWPSARSCGWACRWACRS
jgi:multidrug resistance protein, MATE family